MRGRDMAASRQHVVVSDVQRAQYGEEGYLVLPAVIGEEELSELRREASEILDLVVRSSLSLQRRNPRLDIRRSGAGRAIVRKIQPVNDLSAVISNLSVDERLIGPMTEIMGDDPVLMEEKLNYKQPLDLEDKDIDLLENADREGTDEGFLLHHDWGYYRANGYPQTTMSSAIALDDCEARGPIRVVPGSHLVDAALADPGSGSGIVAQHVVGTVPGLVPLNLTAGSVVLFHSKLLHDSEPNLSNKPRRVLIYSHYPKSHDPGGDADRRNRPTRERAALMEKEYREKVTAGRGPDLA
jgi:ectoine hydroxylase-related dioxygenase (phytanoyl-CoA dioxygenase family)